MTKHKKKLIKLVRKHILKEITTIIKQVASQQRQSGNSQLHGET